MSSPCDVLRCQYSQLQEDNISLQDFNAPLSAGQIHTLIKNDYKSRRPRRYFAYGLSVVGFICLMSGIIIVNQKLQPPHQPPIQSNLTSACPVCPSPATTLPTPTPCPSPKVPTACPTTSTAGLAQVAKFVNDFDRVKAYDGALYLLRKQKATFDDAKVKLFLLH